MNIVDAENLLKDAFATDVRPMLADWRKRKSIDPNPLAAYRASGYEARVAREREAARATRGPVSGASFA